MFRSKRWIYFELYSRIDSYIKNESTIGKITIVFFIQIGTVFHVTQQAMNVNSANGQLTCVDIILPKQSRFLT